MDEKNVDNSYLLLVLAGIVIVYARSCCLRYRNFRIFGHSRNLAVAPAMSSIGPVMLEVSAEFLDEP